MSNLIFKGLKENLVFKENPYHDEKGRFASKNGGVAASNNGDAVVFKKGFSYNNLKNHWYGNEEKRIHSHKNEYKGMSMKEYGERALSLIQKPTNGIKGYTNGKGQVIRYDPKTNDFVKGNPQKGIATMFKPTNGYKYYKGQEQLKKGIDDMENSRLICPCCGKYQFEEEDFYEYCEVCGWQDDPVQRDDPDYEGGANKHSLNYMRKDWEEYCKTHKISVK